MVQASLPASTRAIPHAPGFDGRAAKSIATDESSVNTYRVSGGILAVLFAETLLAPALKVVVRQALDNSMLASVCLKTSHDQRPKRVFDALAVPAAVDWEVD
jgi:hypothetical protein